MLRSILLAALLCGPALAADAPDDLLPNGGFEQGTTAWRPVWSRDGSATATLDPQIKHAGRQSLRIEHTGANDWSLNPERRLDVQPGQLFELTAWVRVRGQGSTTLGVTLRDPGQNVTEWSFAGRSARAATSDDWQPLRTKFVVPPGTASVEPRLTGTGPATVWVDDLVMVRTGTLEGFRAGALPATLKLASKDLELTLHPAQATFDVTDRRGGGSVWQQRRGGSLLVTSARRDGEAIRLDLIDPASLLRIAVALRLEPAAPELVVELSSDGELAGTIDFPAPFATRAGIDLILPVNEGIAYPAADTSLQPMHYHLYGGHGLCMPWHGQTDGQRGVLAIVETPDDAAVKVPRLDGLLHLVPQWVPQKGRFGPTRRIRYVFFDDGGYVAMAKRYRRHSIETGRLKTFVEKRKANPNVDLLIGAVNIWCWDRDPVALVRELQAAGLKRILWSNRAEPEALRQMNALNVLTSRYDIYQDVMDPANFPKLGSIHPDWTTEAWPKDIIRRADGSWLPGWEVKGKDGVMYPCGVLCDSRAVEYARRRITEELKTHPYRCRFLDTTTAAPWNECYAPEHPMTRTESRKFKMDLLRFVSEECGLVTGSETGHDAAVPVVHYFEGMLSLGPYRVPDSGRNTARIVEDVPERVAKFQTGHQYRLPLWELVYHDCVVAQWYWGDYNNKLPALWDRRDLWNALYGTPPMFMFDRKLWSAHRDRFVQSYRTAIPVARATGYVEMLAHRWLTADHAVQESKFANGVTVTVNFGDHPHALPDGSKLPPLGHRVTGPVSEGP